MQNQPLPQVIIPDAYHVAVSFERRPDAKPVTMDVFAAYDKAAEMHVDHGDDWLHRWGEWISEQCQTHHLLETELACLWKQVSEIRDHVIADCIKRAAVMHQGAIKWLAPSLN